MMEAAIREVESGPGDEIFDGAGHQHLAGTGEGRDACASVVHHPGMTQVETLGGYRCALAWAAT
jgi:hypothetical protein